MGIRETSLIGTGREPARGTLLRAAALLLAAAGAARGQCALHDVPALLPGGATTRLGLAWRETALAAAPGSLSEAEVSAVFAPGPRWEWSWRWPFAVLDAPAGTAAGLGDPAWELGFRDRSGAFIWGASGLVSVPLGNAGNGLGADAFGAAGFLSAAWAGDGWSAGALAGLHGMYGGGMAHAHAAGEVPLSAAYTLAHPHADREFLYRASWEGESPFGWGLALDGSHALGAVMGVTGTDFLEGEATLRFTFAGTAWKPSARFPLSPDRRLLFGLGLAATRDW